MKRINKYAVVLVFLLLCITSNIKVQLLNIKNDIFWNTKDGQPIYSQGGNKMMIFFSS